MKKILNNEFTIEVFNKLNPDELIILSNEIRTFLINLSSEKDIHLSSNLGIVELSIALLKSFNIDKDKILYDTGHQTYVHKMITNRFNRIKTIRDHNGLAGLMNMDESKYDHYSPGHSGNILAISQGYRIESNLNHIVAVVGDGALNNGLCYESMNDIGFRKDKIIMILNDNEMSISENVGNLSIIAKDEHKMKNYFNALGFEYLRIEDGHNIDKLIKIFNNAKEISKTSPVCVHVKTTKGKGHDLSEIDKIGKYHSTSKTRDQSFSKKLTNNIIDLMKKDKDIFVINPAMGFSSDCYKIHDEYPQRYFDVGICEEHAVAKAGALSLVNKKPILFFYSTFLQRTYDQLIHDVSRLKLNITILLDRSDISGSEGDSHHGIYDISFLKTINNTNIVSGRNFVQNEQLLNLSLDNKNEIFIIRFPKKPFDEKTFNENYIIQNNKWEFIENFESETIIVSYGPYLDLIHNEIMGQYKVNLANAIFINKYDESEIDYVLLKYKNILIYERINNKNTLSDDFMIRAFKLKSNNNIISMSYKKDVGFGNNNELDREQNMDINSIKKELETLIK